MFGFDETIEYQKSPQDEIKELAQRGIDYIRARPNFCGKDVAGFFEIADAICAKINELSPDQRGHASMYATSLTTMRPQAFQMARLPATASAMFYQSTFQIIACNWLPEIIKALS